MEKKVVTIRAHSKEVIGNKKFKTWIMISFQTEKNGDIHDLFLDKEKAEHFQKELNKKMEQNSLEE